MNLSRSDCWNIIILNIRLVFNGSVVMRLIYFYIYIMAIIASDINVAQLKLRLCVSHVTQVTEIKDTISRLFSKSG